MTTKSLTRLNFPYPYTLDLTTEELQQGNYYLVGDIRYLVPEKYLTTAEYCPLHVDETYIITKKPTLTLFSTGGDGLISDASGRLYTIERGTFGCIKAEFLPKEEILDCIRFFKKFENDCIAKGLDDFAIGNLAHFVKVQTPNVFAEIGIPEKPLWDCHVPYDLDQDGWLEPWYKTDLLIGKTVDEPW